MSNTITVENAPRDIQGLTQTSRTVRYRLGLSINMWGGDQSAEESFLGLDDASQAQALQTALQQFDASNGAQAAPAAAPQAVPAPQPAPMAPAVPQAPQMPPMAPQAALRAPSTTVDPHNRGAIPQQQPVPTAAPPQAAPTNNGSGTQLVVATQGLSQQVAELRKLVDEEVAGAADLQELKEIVLGMARTQQTIAVMCLLLAEQQLQLPRAAVVNVVADEIKREGIKALLQKQDEGKG